MIKEVIDFDPTGSWKKLDDSGEEIKSINKPEELAELQADEDAKNKVSKVKVEKSETEKKV
jgi:hypothetical protein